MFVNQRKALSRYLEHRYCGVRQRIVKLYEVARGLDIMQYHTLEELSLDPERSVWYVNSGNGYLRRALQKIVIKEEDRFFDFGAGKGGALFTALKCGFRQVGGVEISPALAKIALQNATRLGYAAKIVLHVADAATLSPEVLCPYSHFYFYNPFPSTVMGEVVTNLVKSLDLAPRDALIIYKNPVCHTQIVATGRFRLVEVVKADFGMTFHLYLGTHTALSPQKKQA